MPAARARQNTATRWLPITAPTSRRTLARFALGDELPTLKNINLGGALKVQAEEMTEENFWFIVGRHRSK
mgnify:CR=1 FL=1